MSPRHRHRMIPASSILISYLTSSSNAAFVNDFSAYPVNARSCLDTAAAASGCTGSTVTQMNTCLCGNGGNFVLAAAKCVEKQAKDDLDDVYEILLTSCTDSKTPLGVSQAQFLDPEDDDDDKSTVSSVSSSTAFATSIRAITTPPTVAPPALASATTSTSLTTYKSVAPGGVTVTVTRGIEVVPTATDSGKQDSNSDESDSDKDGSSPPGLAAGLVGGLALVIGALAFFCYRRRRQRKERQTQVGAGGKFAALSSATSLTTMTASPPQGQATTAYNGPNDRRPDTAHTMQMAAGTASWGRQPQQHGQQSPQHWQNNAPNQYGQAAGTWPSPVTNTDGSTGTWGVSPVSQYPTNSSRGHESPPSQNATWNAHALPVGVPAPHPSHPANNTYSPVFELPGDETQAVEADSTPIGHAQAIRPPSRSIQSTPAHMSAQPTQPAPAHHGMPRQIDDALQISRVELPPPRYSGPASGSEWVSEDKKFG